MRKGKSNNTLASDLLIKSFKGLKLESMVSASRTFPVTSRVDLQLALERQFLDFDESALFGLHPQYSHETLTFSHLLAEHNYPVIVGPLQHEEIDIGEIL